MLNSDFIEEQARILAKEILRVLSRTIDTRSSRPTIEGHLPSNPSSRTVDGRTAPCKEFFERHRDDPVIAYQGLVQASSPPQNSAFWIELIMTAEHGPPNEALSLQRNARSLLAPSEKRHFCEPLFMRREILERTACGFGWLAFAGHAAQLSAADPNGRSLAPKIPPLKASAKRVIFLCMRGAPSHVDLLDYKPQLVRDSGKPGPKPGSELLGSKWRFSQRGQSGLWISELLPNFARHADKLCMIHSMQTDLPAHPQAFNQTAHGHFAVHSPVVGSLDVVWAWFRERQSSRLRQHLATQCFEGRRITVARSCRRFYQGTRIGQEGRSVKNATMANLRSRLQPSDQRAELDLIQAFNRKKLATTGPNPEIDGVIESYELAFRCKARCRASSI